MATESQIARIRTSFYDVGADFPQWAPVLEHLTEVLGGVGCDLHVLRDGVPLLGFMGGATADALAEYRERFINREPRSLYLMTAATGKAVTDDDMLASRARRRHEYFAEFLPRHGLGACVAAVPLRTPDATAYLGFHLAADAGAADRTLVSHIESLLPDMQRALHMQVRLLNAELRHQMVSSAFERLNLGMLILGDRQQILTDNAAARAILRDGSILTVKAGKLVAAVPREAAELDVIVKSAIARSGRLGGNCLLRGKHGKALAVSVSPAPQAARDATGAAAHVFLNPLERPRRRDAEVALRDLFHLTVTEARIASLLARGRSPKEIAAALAMTYESVRFGIKQVFSKAQVHRQAEFVALVCTLLPDIIEL